MKKFLCLLAVAGLLSTGLMASDAKAADDYYAQKMKALKAKEKASGDYAAKMRAMGKQAKAEAAVYDSQEKALAAGAARAHVLSVNAAAKQDKVCKVVGFVPGVGYAMRNYNSGEMKAYYAGKGNESYYGFVHAFFKVPAGCPENWTTDLVYQFTGSDWREQDPFSVWAVDGRPYWMDCMVIGTKVFFGLAGANVIHAGLPNLGYVHPPASQAFLWVAAGGSSLNLVAGTADQAARGMTPYHQYYQQYQKWVGKPPTMPFI